MRLKIKPHNHVALRNNVRKIKQVFIILLIMLTATLQATNLPIFKDQDFVPNTLIVSISAEAIG